MPEAAGADLLRGLKVALVHDWLTGMRGGERVLEILCRGFPNAPILTLFHVPGTVSETISRHPITVSRLNGWPGAARHYRCFAMEFHGELSYL